MRLICVLNDQKKGRQLSSLLTAEGIENQLEINTNTDWGSSGYGDISCKIWIIDEDCLEAALGWLDRFEKNPNDPIFNAHKATIDPAVTATLPKAASFPFPNRKTSSTVDQELRPLGPITIFFLIVCSALFILTELTSPTITPYPLSLPPVALFSSPVKKQMLYDYPKTYEIVDDLVKLYGIERLQNPQELPREGQYLFAQFQKTPFWQGFYPEILKTIDHPDQSVNQQAPLFEKIRQGEVWRLFTPCLLHSDILHILFNMLWLIALGKQIEERLSSFRYVLLILLIGIFSNTCQYLMSGPNFIGFSGVICGMLTFIWMRQKTAAWEGYPLQKSTINFLLFFIFAMFFIQVISFYLESLQKYSFMPGIANTAHLSGAAIGVLLGRLSFFSRQT